MYPSISNHPFIEEDIDNGSPMELKYGYAYSKRIMGYLSRAYRDQYGINAICLIPSEIIGKYSDNRMISSIIKRFIDNRNNSNLITIWGDGSIMREYTYNEDIYKIFLWCYEHYNDRNFLNIGTTEGYSVKDISYMISDYLNIDRNRLFFDSTKPQGERSREFDNSNFLRLNDFKYTKFDKVLKEVIDWHIQHHDNS
jgi:GDP-L-fucose synthase